MGSVFSWLTCRGQAPEIKYPRRGRSSLVVLGLLAACDADPQPGQTRTGPLSIDDTGAIPSDHDLAIEITEALAKQRREALDKALDAKEPGELYEHASLSQAALDRGIFGPADLFRFGDDLFALQFRPEQGLGNALVGFPGAGTAAAPNLRRVQQGNFGGPDAMGCAECHRVGGDDGAGTLTQNTYFRSDGDRTLIADVRNPPQVLGLGPIQALANEMTRDLQQQRDALRAQAIDTGIAATAPLQSKLVGFGRLTVFPDGSVDTSLVEGVSPDLIVRPFGWKGHQGTLRGMVKESFRQHLGLVALSDQQRIRDGLLAPTEFGDGPWFDIDDDGVTVELEDGMVSTMVGYLSQIEVPIVKPPDDQALLDRFATGRALFVELCDSCHRSSMILTDTVVETRAEQTENAASPVVRIDVASDGPRPKIDALDLQGNQHVVRLFSDLKRHDMGSELAAPIDQVSPDGGGTIAATRWLTRPLWGLADTAPYLHDGRAPTIDDAIRAHGGEGDPARTAYLARPIADRISLQIYLLSLQRVRRVEGPP